MAVSRREIRAYVPRHRAQSGAVQQRVREDTVLRPVSGRPDFYTYLQQLAERWSFIRMQSWAQASTRHRGMLLGNLWLILAPLLDAAVYALIFGVLFTSGDDNIIAYIVIGVFMFTYSSRTIIACTSSISSNESLIRAFVFPKAALPLATVLRETISTIPMVLTLAILVMVVPPHEPITAAWLAVPFIFVLQTGLNLGLGLLMARIGAALPDFRQLLPYGMRFLMYGSAVIFTIDRFDAIPWVRPLIEHNPFYILLDMYRRVLMDAEFPRPERLMELTLWVVGSLLIGMFVFWRAEAKYGRK